jgi:hypothetical protein
MNFISDIKPSIFVFPFPGETQETEILKAMELAYNRSPSVQIMFDGWVSIFKKKIFIYFAADKFEARLKSDTYGNLITDGKLYIDLAMLQGRGYIDDKGRARPYLLVQALIHELGHAILGLKDDNDNVNDYLGDNARFINNIWREIDPSFPR